MSGWNCKNIGIVTGRVSKLLVLDTDEYKETFDRELFKSFKIPLTPVQETASGGKQYFFRLPDDIEIRNDVCIGTKDSGIDIRAEGGMVIAPPSSTPYGTYSWNVSPFETGIAEIPPTLLSLITSESGINLKIRTSLPELIGLEEGGGRNNAIASVVGKLLTTTPRDSWDNEVWPVVQTINQTYKPPLSEEELTSVYRSITKIESGKMRGGMGGSMNIENPEYMPAISHSELIAREFKPARYTIEPFFEQGTMNMVSAPPNTWKSWLLFLFAGHIANGTDVFDKFSTEKANVMIVNEEDSARLVQDRLRLLDVTDITLPIYYRIAQGSKLTLSFIEQLINEAKTKNVGVIMFDSLRAVHEADENDSTAMQGVMDLLKKIVREDITVIFTHHHRKKGMFTKNDDSESSRGSSAINAAISGHISLTEVNDVNGSKYLVLKHLKSKVGEKLQPIDIDIEVGETIKFQYLGEHETQDRAENEAKDKILSALQGREELLSRKDFVHLKVAGQTTVKKALKSLENEGRIRAISRKETVLQGLGTFSDGKSNEILYSLVLSDHKNDGVTGAPVLFDNKSSDDF